LYTSSIETLGIDQNSTIAKGLYLIFYLSRPNFKKHLFFPSTKNRYDW